MKGCIMHISSILVLIALILGVIGSYFLVKGTHSILFEEIREQIKGGWWVSDNLALAKSMITEKSRARYGFFLLILSFSLQLISVLIDEMSIKIKIPMIPAFIFLVVTALFAYFYTCHLIDKRDKKDWQEY